MKRLLLLVTLILALGVSPVYAANIDFTAPSAFSGNIFTGADGIDFTVETDAIVKAWDNNGLQVQFKDGSQYVKLVFSSPVQLDGLSYQGGANGAVLLVTDSNQQIYAPVEFVPGGNYLDLSAYDNITSITIMRGEGVNGAVGVFAITGLGYNGLSTPIPAAIWLLGSGLAGVAVLRRKLR